MTNKEALSIISYKELHQYISCIKHTDACDTHIALELAICSSQVINEEQRLELLALLFIVSCRQGIYQPRALIERADGLVVDTPIKRHLAEVIHELQSNPEGLCEHVKAMINDSFASPIATEDALAKMAIWIRQYPALQPAEQETLSTMARQCELLLMMANSGDDSAKEVLRSSRIQWFVEHISNATHNRQLQQIETMLTEDNLVNISAEKVTPLINHAMDSLKTLGYVDLNGCVTQIIHSVIYPEYSPAPSSYQKNIKQVKDWLSDKTSSPLVSSLLAISRKKTTHSPLVFSKSLFKKKSLFAFSY